MCACMHVCMHVQTCICMHIRIYPHSLHDDYVPVYIKLYCMTLYSLRRQSAYGGRSFFCVSGVVVGLGSVWMGES